MGLIFSQLGVYLINELHIVKNQYDEFFNDKTGKQVYLSELEKRIFELTGSTDCSETIAFISKVCRKTDRERCENGG